MLLRSLNNQMKDNEEPIVEVNKAVFEFKPNELHVWRQQGPYLVCKSCDLQHAVFVGIDRLMTGIDEKGRPILKVKKDE